MFHRRLREKIEALRERDRRSKEKLERAVRWIRALPVRAPFSEQLIYKIEEVIADLTDE